MCKVAGAPPPLMKNPPAQGSGSNKEQARDNDQRLH
jgi:hypothetical protein